MKRKSFYRPIRFRIKVIDYDTKTQVLEVAFKRDGVFRYEGVPCVERPEFSG